MGSCWSRLYPRLRRVTGKDDGATMQDRDVHASNVHNSNALNSTSEGASGQQTSAEIERQRAGRPLTAFERQAKAFSMYRARRGERTVLDDDDDEEEEEEGNHVGGRAGRVWAMAEIY